MADSPMLDPLFRGTAAGEVFSDTARLQGMLDFEVALARAGAKAGYAFDRLMRRIIEVARARYLSAESIAAMSVDPPNDAKPDAVPPAVNSEASWSRLGSG
jgi:3-carboxy-cis,cis-muconate cycloisomerase